MATYVPKSYADLEKWILQQSMSKVQDAMTKRFYNIFYETFLKYLNRWYGEYSPSVYPRIDEFKSKLPVEIKPYVDGRIIKCGIKFDETELSHSAWRVSVDGRNFSGTHHGKNNEDAYEIVKDALLEGGHGFYEYTETAPYVDTLEELKNNMSLFINELKNELSKNGFIVK